MELKICICFDDLTIFVSILVKAVSDFSANKRSLRVVLLDSWLFTIYKQLGKISSLL